MSELDPRLAPYFADRGQQNEAVTQGMWLFLVTEIMFFGGLFMAYILYRSWFPAGFAAASHHLDVTLGAVNTAVLLLSSFTMVMSVHFSQHGKRGWSAISLVLTALLGCGFLGIKAVEYGHKFHEHLIPGDNFVWGGPEAPGQVHMFFNLYFAMTGLHALHMIIGVGLVLALVTRTLRGDFDSDYNAPVEITGLYWHFVDLVWIFLFPLLYLLGRH